MTRKEASREQFEQALFAYLMESAFEARAKEAEEENQRLKADPSAAVPEESQKVCRKTIDRAFRKQKARHAGRISLKVLNRVAIVVAVFTICFSTAFAASETVRVGTLNALLEVNETFASFSFRSESSHVENTSAFTVEWIPEKYTLDSVIEDDFRYREIYQDSEGNSIGISMYAMENGSYTFDSEGDVEEINISGYSGLMIEKDGEILMAWAITDKASILEICADASGISMEGLLLVAENITY